MVEKQTLDHADLVMLTMYHMEANTDRGCILADIDELIKMATGFYVLFSKVNWEDHDMDWESALTIYYNGNKPQNWNSVEMA